MNSLLVKLTRRARRAAPGGEGGGEAQQAEQQEEDYSAEAVAVVEAAYRCVGGLLCTGEVAWCMPGEAVGARGRVAVGLMRC